MKNNKKDKKPVALRLDPNLVALIDNTRELTRHSTRTRFIEEACYAYCDDIQKTICNVPDADKFDIL